MTCCHCVGSDPYPGKTIKLDRLGRCYYCKADLTEFGFDLVKLLHLSPIYDRIPGWGKGPEGYPLALFCPHCGEEYPGYLDTVTILAMFGPEPPDIIPPVIRRCYGCAQWEFPAEARDMIRMLG